MEINGEREMRWEYIGSVLNRKGEMKESEWKVKDSERERRRERKREKDREKEDKAKEVDTKILILNC